MLACVRGGKPAKGHKTYPYLLRGLRADRPSQVWCLDITYLPPLGRFAVQIACRAMVDALNEAIHRFGPPDIMNSDQGSQFTSFA